MLVKLYSQNISGQQNKFSNKWRIDLSVYNDIPKDDFIVNTSLHLNKDNYSLGYHFQGGPFAYGKYKIENNTLILEYPDRIVYEGDINTYLLNKIFPQKKTQVFTYDSSYKTVSYCGCIKNENAVFADMNNPSPVNEEYDYDGIKVIKLEKFDAYSKETMKLRMAPDTTSEIGKMSYGIDEYDWVKNEYHVIAYKDTSVPYLIAGKICSITMRTVAEEELYGIKAPWYRVGIWGGVEDRGHYFWIWGGYIEEFPDPEDSKKVNDLFIKEALRLQVVKKASM